MARVLFFLQLIVALVVLPLWPGVGPGYLGLGLVFLGVVVLFPLAAMGAVYGGRTTLKALTDAWSTGPLGKDADLSLKAWELAVETVPLAGLVGVGVTTVGGLATGSSPVVVALFTLVWCLLALLIAVVLREVVKGLAAAPSAPLLEVTPPVAARYSLTPREAEVAQAVLDGLTYQGVAEKLSIGAATVKSHVLSVYQKTGAGNKLELLRMVEAETARLHQTVDGAPRPPGRG